MNNPPMHLFLEACGASEPIRAGVGPRDVMQSETRTFDRPFLVIGRSAESDLTLEHWQVSRRHAYLQLLGGRYFCVDLGSRTGTHGGDATERMGWLGEGRAIQIGPYTVRPDPPSRRPRDGRPLPGVTWELPGQAPDRAIWRMDWDIALVGRSPACQLRIFESDVSKFHCSLVLTRLGVWVVDLLARDGVFVNDERVRCARLEEGDELRVGRHIIRPRYDAAPPPLEADRTSSGAIMPSPSGLPSPLDNAGLPAWSTPGREVAPFVERAGGAADPTVMVLVQQFGMMQQQMFDQFHNTMMMMFEGFAALHRETSGTLREEFERVRELSREIEALRVETAKLAEAARAPKRLVPPPLNGNGAQHRPIPVGPAPADPIKRAAPPPPDPHVDIHAQLLGRLSSIESERQNRWQKILGMMSSKS